MKKATIIRVEAEILKRAKELGLNITQVCENALKLYINAIENANKQITANQTANPEKGKEGFGNVVSEWACPDSNRGPSPREGDVLTN